MLLPGEPLSTCCSSDMTPLATTSRVPAWKKLGLELKFAKERPTDNESSSKPIAQENTSPPELNKKRPVFEQNGGTTTKKQKLENGAIDDPKGREDQSSKRASNPIESSESKPKEQDGQKQKKKKARKSVSFAADTKSSPDHDEQKREAEAESEAITSEKRRAEKRLKRERRPKRQPVLDEPNEHNSAPSDPILAYISVYHKARSQWKFQKNRETALLKHLLSVDKIPSSYNAALSAYLSGLKSDGARSRVAESATEAIEADAADLGKAETQDDDEKGRYESEIASFKDKLARERAELEEGREVGDEASSSNLTTPWPERLEKRKRAELVYVLVRGGVPSEGQQKASAKTRPQPMERTRKMRTAIIEDTSSDASSDSDSDSEASTSNATSKKRDTRSRNGTDSSSSSSDADSGSSSGKK